VRPRTWVPSLVRCQSSFTRSAALRVRSFVSSTTPRTCSAADLELDASETHQISSSTPQILTSAPQAISSRVRQASMKLRLPGVPHSLQPNPVFKQRKPSKAEAPDPHLGARPVAPHAVASVTRQVRAPLRRARRLQQ
jgi:hypothetical protein